MTIWLTIWVVLMVLWLFGGCWVAYDPARPQVLLGGTVVPWVCVLILGLVVFGAVTPGPIR